VQNETGLDIEHMEMLRKAYEDFERRAGAAEDGVPVEAVGPILGLCGLRPETRDLQDALMELADLDINEVGKSFGCFLKELIDRTTWILVSSVGSPQGFLMRVTSVRFDE
jgi:hypothetical protein